MAETTSITDFVPSSGNRYMRLSTS